MYHHELFLACLSLTTRLWRPWYFEYTGQFEPKLCKDNRDLTVCTRFCLFAWGFFFVKMGSWIPFYLPPLEKNLYCELIHYYLSDNQDRRELIVSVSHLQRKIPVRLHPGRGHKAGLASLVLVLMHTTALTGCTDTIVIITCWILLCSSLVIQHVASGPFLYTPSNPTGEYRTSILSQGSFIALVTVAWVQNLQWLYFHTNLMVEGVQLSHLTSEELEEIKKKIKRKKKPINFRCPL